MMDQLETLIKSHYWSEINLWQSLPALMLFALVIHGLHHIMSQRRSARSRRVAQRSERRRCPLPLMISTPVTQEFSVNTYDVSTTGAFLHYEDIRQSMTFASLLGRRSGIKVGDLIEVRVLTGRFSSFRCQARVARLNFDNQSPHPQGVAIEFMNLSPRKKRSLAAVIYKLPINQSA